MALATLEEMAAQADLEPDEIISSILERLDDEDRGVFLSGLSELIVQNREDVPRWVGSWLISSILVDDPSFLASDEEATQLVECGKISTLTGAGLRARYGR